MPDDTWTWTGASGNRYVYYVYEGVPELNGPLGLYIYAKRTGDQAWLPVYIGEGDLASRCEGDAELMACIAAKGATHVHLRQHARESDRRQERADLLKAHLDAYAPTGCNQREQPVHLWAGISGDSYTFYVYDKAEPMPPRLGLYICARWADHDGWRPLYIGHGDLSSRQSCVDGIDRCLEPAGCTHVHVRLARDEPLRRFIHRDLLRRHPAVFAPVGCQPEADRPDAAVVLGSRAIT